MSNHNFSLKWPGSACQYLKSRNIDLNPQEYRFDVLFMNWFNLKWELEWATVVLMPCIKTPPKKIGNIQRRVASILYGRYDLAQEGANELDIIGILTEIKR